MSTVTRTVPLPRTIAAFIANACLAPLKWVLWTNDPHATLDRLFVSPHVKDLRLIAAFSLFVLYAIALAIVLDISFQPQLRGWSTASRLLAFLGPTLAVVAAVLGWVYQTGSARLGVVDLFACEICTLCRVAAVNDTVRHHVVQFREGVPPAPSAAAPAPLARAFTSQENYFPVFESNPSNLQTLDYKVVVNITAFYTYMKAVRDALRTLAAIGPAPEQQPSSTQTAQDLWRDAARNVIYMLFLAFESARLAIAQLVEFPPESVECSIIVLISELEAYHFLCGQYKNPKDVHHTRIRLRAEDYQDKARAAYQLVAQGSQSPDAHLWRWAVPLLPELAKRFKAATGSAITDPRPVQG